jgi:ABC-type transport system involved in multi-copper enzyme maturation permease subunit
MGMGNRPQGYVLLTRRLGRGGYFAGLYLAALLVSVGAYLALLAAALAGFWAQGQPLNTSPAMLFQGSLPLLLDQAVLASTIALLAPLTLGRRARLPALAVLAVALASDLGDLRLVDPTGALALLYRAAHLALAPATNGFALAVAHTLTPAAAGILAGQVALAAALLALALGVFARRDLILGA